MQKTPSPIKKSNENQKKSNLLKTSQKDHKNIIKPDKKVNLPFVMKMSYCLMR